MFLLLQWLLLLVGSFYVLLGSVSQVTWILYDDIFANESDEIFFPIENKRWSRTTINDVFVCLLCFCIEVIKTKQKKKTRNTSSKLRTSSSIRILAYSWVFKLFFLTRDFHVDVFLLVLCIFHYLKTFKSLGSFPFPSFCIFFQ